MKYLSLLLTIFFLHFQVLPSYSQEIRVSPGKNNINLNEDFTISLLFPREFKKELQGFLFPEIADFVKVKTRFEVEKKSSNYIISQNYRPLKAGVFKMNSFKVITERQTILSPAITIVVTNTSLKKITLNPEFQNAHFKPEKVEIFFTVSSNKKSVYTGEELIIVASLLIGENNRTGFNFFDFNDQILKISRGLETKNCLIDEYSKGMIEQPRFDTVYIKNKLYKRLKIFERKVYPLNSSDIKFPPLEFKLIKYMKANVLNDILWKPEELKLISQPLKIQVKDLPDHPLRDRVAVGSFQLKEAISSNKLKTGKAFNYLFIITGDGNMAALHAPEIAENDNFDVYSPEIREQTSVKNGKDQKTKIYQYNIVPKEPGLFKIEDYFQWIYFDPYKEQYDTLKSRISLKITGESQKNIHISSSDPGSFYALTEKESNALIFEEKDELIKIFANIIILFMLVTTAILIFRR